MNNSSSYLLAGLIRANAPQEPHSGPHSLFILIQMQLLSDVQDRPYARQEQPVNLLGHSSEQPQKLSHKIFEVAQGHEISSSPGWMMQGPGCPHCSNGSVHCVEGKCVTNSNCLFSFFMIMNIGVFLQVS